MYSRYSRPLFRLALLLLISILLVGCATSNPPEPPSDGPEQIIPEEEPGLPATMGIVLDSSGSPIGNALVGSTEVTTSEGIFSGTLENPSSGWITVEALGYLDGYAKPFGTMKGVDLYQIWLTPIQTGTLFSIAPEGIFSIPLSPSIELQVMTSQEQFDPPAIAIEGAAIDLIDIGPYSEPIATEADLELVAAFGLVAYNESLDRVNMTPGSSLPISILDSGQFSDATVLATFDAVEGTWIIQEQTCSRDAPDMLNCTLTTLSPLIAIFDSSTSLASENQPSLSVHHGATVGAVLPGISTYLADRFFAPTHDAIQDYKDAKRAYDDYINEHGEIDPGDPEGRSILNNFIDSARNMANAQPGEGGKTGLIAAASAAYEAGDLEAGDQLSSEAADMANKLAEKDLQESDCGQFEKLLKRAQQLQLVAGDEGLEQQLKDRAKEMVVDCDVWNGTIRVWMISSSSHPGGLDMQAAGAPPWFEIHDVNLWTNVETYELHGTDNIQLNFPPVNYVREHECRNDIKISGEPANGLVRLEYEGRYNGYEFQIIEPPGAIGSVSIVQTHHFEAKKSDICNVITDSKFSAPNYMSVIAHGFEYGSPPITLQEMLAEGSPGQYGEITTISGAEDLSNPDPDTGKYPFVTAHITWRFRHIQPKLPIDDQSG